MLVPFCVSRISIHAPAKGATKILSHVIRFKKFQSTLPRRERRQFCFYFFCFTYFNPRSREGSDSKYAQFFIMILAYLHNIITYFLIKTI